VAKQALGQEVFGHLVHLAKQEELAWAGRPAEQSVDGGAVTGWELARYFERG
jgi:hypothetical protein